MTSEEFKTAIKLFDQKEYNKAAKIFDKLDLKYEAGYCEFAKGNLDKAKYIWEKSQIDSPAINWGYSIINLINKTIPFKLSYFQIRNFLERDIDILLENNHIGYVNNILDAEKILYKFNSESYKYLGRVLLHACYFDLAYEFLLKARDICYADPEVHVLIAEYFLFNIEKEKGIAVLEEAVKLNPDYFPAKSLLESEKEMLKKL